MNTYFREINYLPLRTWNQTRMMFNIREDEGDDASRAYAAGFTRDEKLAALGLIADIKKRGYEVVRAELNRTMPLQLDEEDEELNLE